MKHPRPNAPLASGALTRRSVGLTDAHKALIRILAEIAVAGYLREVETPSIHCELSENVAVRQGEAVVR